MAVDLTGVNQENTPPRMRLIAKYLVENDPDQLAALDAESQTFYNYVYNNVPPFGTPGITVSIASKDVGTNSATVSVYSDDPDTPLTWFYSLSDTVNYGATVTSVPSAAATEATVSGGTFSVSDGGFTAGTHTKIAVQAHDAEDTAKGELELVDLIYAPAAPTNIAAGDGTGQTEVIWDPMDGAASYNVYYIEDAGGAETAETIISSGTQFTGTIDPLGTTITGLAAGTCRVTVTATNPGGTSDGGTPDNATIS
jgi:hypothetical protein